MVSDLFSVSRCGTCRLGSRSDANCIGTSRQAGLASARRSATLAFRLLVGFGPRLSRFDQFCQALPPLGLPERLEVRVFGRPAPDFASPFILEDRGELVDRSLELTQLREGTRQVVSQGREVPLRRFLLFGQPR